MPRLAQRLRAEDPALGVVQGEYFGHRPAGDLDAADELITVGRGDAVAGGQPEVEPGEGLVFEK